MSDLQRCWFSCTPVPRCFTGFVKAWVPAAYGGLRGVVEIRLSGGTSRDGLSRRVKGGGKHAAPAVCWAGVLRAMGVESLHCNVWCHAGLRCTPHLSKTAFFSKHKSYFSYVKVQCKGLFEKQGLKTFLLQELWTGCDWQTQSPWAIWCWILKQLLKMPNWYSACHIKMPSCFIHFHCNGVFFIFHYKWVTWKMEDFPSSKKKSFQAWLGSHIAIILLKRYLQYCVNPIKLSGNDLQ